MVGPSPVSAKANRGFPQRPNRFRRPAAEVRGSHRAAGSSQKWRGMGNGLAPLVRDGCKRHEESRPVLLQDASLRSRMTQANSIRVKLSTRVASLLYWACTGRGIVLLHPSRTRSRVSAALCPMRSSRPVSPHLISSLPSFRPRSPMTSKGMPIRSASLNLPRARPGNRDRLPARRLLPPGVDRATVGPPSWTVRRHLTGTSNASLAQWRPQNDAVSVRSWFRPSRR